MLLYISLKGVFYTLKPDQQQATHALALSGKEDPASSYKIARVGAAKEPGRLEENNTAMITASNDK